MSQTWDVALLANQPAAGLGDNVGDGFGSAYAASVAITAGGFAVLVASQVPVDVGASAPVLPAYGGQATAPVLPTIPIA